MTIEYTAASVRTRVIGIVSDLTAIAPDDIKAEDRLREDLGLDSVASMELLSALAEDLELNIEMEEAIAITTVEEMVRAAEERLNVS